MVSAQEKRVVPRVLALLYDASERERLLAALQSHADVEFSDDCESLLLRAKEQGLDIGIIELRGEATSATAMQRLRRRFRRLPLVAYVKPGRGISRNLTLACQSGADAFVIAGYDDLATRVLALLNENDHDALTRDVLARIRRYVPGPLLAPVSHCFRHIQEARTVDQVAAWSGVSRKTLLHWFRQEGWPAPSLVIVWTKLLVAARYLERSGRTMDTVAERVGLPSATSLRLAFKRYAGLSPKEIRRSGLVGVMRRFVARLPQPQQAHEQRNAARTRDNRRTPLLTTVSPLPEVNTHHPWEPF